MDLLKTALTSLFSAVVLFILAKIMGHKQVSQLNFFDYIAGITIGSIAAEFATELEKPLRPLIAMTVYGLIAFLISIITDKSAKSRKYFNGTPTIIMDSGKLYRKNMKKAKIDLSDFMMLCRNQGYFDLSVIQTAVLEPNGSLSILPKNTERPCTPADLNIAVPEAAFYTEVIADGRILHENLKRRGLNIAWLEKKLKEQGYKNAKEIFLGICDNENNLSLYKNE